MELDEAAAASMARMLVWLDYKQLARVVPVGSPIKTIIHRSAGLGAHNNNVVYEKRFSSDQRENQLKLAILLMTEHETDTLPCTRDAVLSQLSELETEFGTEGGKRFSELSYLAFSQVADETSDQDYEAAANFWADFRTFIDVERVTNVGHAFKVEHFCGQYFVINDENGARIEHPGGAAIKLSDMVQMERGHRSNL